MWGRIAARLLLSALKSPVVRQAGLEVSVRAARSTTAWLLRRLRRARTRQNLIPF